VRQVSRWLEGARLPAKEQGISLLDLFYWEQRLGNWGALYPLEQDIAIEEVSLFSNRKLLMALLRVDPARRMPPNYPMFRSLVKRMWPKVLDLPINPGDIPLLGYLKRSTRVRMARQTLRLWVDGLKGPGSS